MPPAIRRCKPVELARRNPQHSTRSQYLLGAMPPPRAAATVVRRKLDMLHYAHALGDLRSPPSNRVEALRGDLAGLHSIRVNDQFRVTFRWEAGEAHEVRVEDYH